MKTVLLDCRVVSERLDGLSRYTLNLLAALTLRRWDDLRIVAAVPTRLSPEHELERLLRAHEIPNVRSSEPFLSLRTQIRTGSLFERTDADAYHYPHFNLPLNAPRPSVITVHDLSPVNTPHWFRRWGALKRAYFSWALRSSAQRAARVIVPSNATAAVLASAAPAAGAKTVVIPEAADDTFARAPDPDESARRLAPLGVRAPIFLYAGSRRPHKNLERLLRAFATVAGHLPHRLVIAGQAVGDLDRLPRIAEELGVGQRVQWTGYVGEDDLRCLYRIADVFVLVSLGEGFGLGVIEAMASGTPVICSNVGAPAEVAGSAALLVDPLSEREIASALRAVGTDLALREDLRERGLARAALFTWERAAERTIDVYRSLLF